MFGQKGRDLAPLSYTKLFDLTLKDHGQQTRPHEVIDVQLTFLKGKYSVLFSPFSKLSLGKSISLKSPLSLCIQIKVRNIIIAIISDE